MLVPTINYRSDNLLPDKHWQGELRPDELQLSISHTLRRKRMNLEPRGFVPWVPSPSKRRPAHVGMLEIVLARFAHDYIFT